MKLLTFGHVGASVDPLSAFECGVLAEKAGFDTLWLPDHFVDINGDRLEPWTVLSAVAARTKRIRLGSAVTDTQRNHPARTAHAVTSLDVISRGRAILGIGAGEAMNIEPFGLPWESVHERVARLSESIRVIRMLWSSSREKPVSFDGRYYHLKGAYLTQPPRQRPYPPIYIGVFASKIALQVVGQLADGWLPWINTPDTFERRWSLIKEAAELAGRIIK
jgi:phthiodiolone/phenolphthiodiolone dimycocerosates ketoreductase